MPFWINELRKEQLRLGLHCKHLESGEPEKGTAQQESVREKKANEGKIKSRDLTVVYIMESGVESKIWKVGEANCSPCNSSMIKITAAALRRSSFCIVRLLQTKLNEGPWLQSRTHALSSSGTLLKNPFWLHFFDPSTRLCSKQHTRYSAWRIILKQPSIKLLYEKEGPMVKSEF